MGSYLPIFFINHVARVALFVARVARLFFAVFCLCCPCCPLIHKKWHEISEQGYDALSYG